MRKLSKLKQTLSMALVFLALNLMLLPLTTTTNELWTRLIEKLSVYQLLQSYIVPYISRLIYGILARLPGLVVSTFPSGVVVNGTDVRITWNCLGWQSFFILLLTLSVGLTGPYSLRSKMETVLLGVLGTLLVNIFRITLTAALVGWWRGLFVILFHDYFSSFVYIGWLFCFWWFAYRYVLEVDRSHQLKTQL